MHTSTHECAHSKDAKGLIKELNNINFDPFRLNPSVESPPFTGHKGGLSKGVLLYGIILRVTELCNNLCNIDTLVGGHRVSV